MKLQRILVLAALASTLSACDFVLSTHPVGLEPVVVASEDWEGTWVGDDGAFTLRVADGAAGLIELGWIEDNDNRLVLKTGQIHLRSASGWMFASFEDEEIAGSEAADPGAAEPGATELDTAERGAAEPGTTGSGRYLWGRLARDGGRILFWLPSDDKFERLVEAGLLPGTVEEGGDVVLGELDASHLALIASGEHGDLFDWGTPMILRRLDR